MNTTANGQSKQQPPAASRMSLSNVRRGRIEKPIRALIYGTPGVGKSTFAADAPNAIFLCSEDGTAQLDIARLPPVRSWADVLEALKILATEPHDFKTLVVDSLDWLEPIVWAQVCAAGGKGAIEDFGFGKGYVAAVDVWREFIRRLEHLERTRGMNIVLVAHAHIKRIDDPFTGSFDRHRMKLHEKSADLLGEWVDALLFARHEVMAVTKKGEQKARGISTGARILHTVYCAAFDAKNRFSLPDEMPLDWATFEAAVKASKPDAAKLRTELDELLPRLAEERATKARGLADQYAGDVTQLAKLVDRVRSEALIAGGGDE